MPTALSIAASRNRKPVAVVRVCGSSCAAATGSTGSTGSTGRPGVVGIVPIVARGGWVGHGEGARSPRASALAGGSACAFAQVRRTNDPPEVWCWARPGSRLERMYEAHSAPIPTGPSPASGVGGPGVAVHDGAAWTGEDVVWEDDVVDPLDALLAAPPVAAEQLVGQVPGSELAYLLEETLLGEADDHTVVEAVAAWARMVSWAAAGMARAASVLADRPSMNPTWPASAGSVAEPNVAGEELAMRLGCSRRQGRLLVRDGRAFAGALAWTGDALERGQIDAAKARILVDALVDRPVPLALDVQEQVLGGAARRTPAQLARDVAREVVARDPEGAREHHQVGLARRRVDVPRVLPDGMAGIWAVLPAICLL